MAEHGDSVAAIVGIHRGVGVFLLDAPQDVNFMTREDTVTVIDSSNAVSYAVEIMRFMGALPYPLHVIVDEDELLALQDDYGIVGGPRKGTRFLAMVGPAFDVQLVASGRTVLLSVGVLVNPDGSVTTYDKRVYDRNPAIL